MIRRALHGKPRKVLALLAQGYTYQEIANELGMKYDAVQKMVHRMYEEYQTDRAGLLDMWRNRRI